MPFTKWVDTHVHYQRAPRLTAIMMYLEAFGPQLSRNIQAHLARVSVLAGAPTGARMRVTIDTVQRDLALLIRMGYLEAVDQGDRVRLGGRGRQRRVWRYGWADAL
jgi:hypothetical protein